jgi:hypothetical protein
MSPVAAPSDLDLDLDLDLEVVEEISEIDAERKVRCASRPSCCGTRSFRSIDID